MTGPNDCRQCKPVEKKDIAAANILAILEKVDNDTVWYWRREVGGPLEDYLIPKKAATPADIRLAIEIYSEADDYEKQILEQEALVRQYRSGELCEEHTLVVDRIKQADQAPPEDAAEERPSFLQRNSLVDNAGKLVAWKIVLFATVIIGGVIGWVSVISPTRSKGEIRSTFYEALDKNDWATDANRQKHVLNLAGLCQSIEQFTRHGGTFHERILELIDTTDKYLAQIAEKDPNFAGNSPAVYKEFQQYVEKYQTLRQLHLSQKGREPQ